MSFQSTIHCLKITLSYIQIQHEVVCTLGPACWDVDQLETLIDAGMSVARFNFSHGDHGGHQACLDRLREAAANKKSHVGMFNDMLFMVKTLKNICNLKLQC